MNKYKKVIKMKVFEDCQNDLVVINQKYLLDVINREYLKAIDIYSEKYNEFMPEITGIVKFNTSLIRGAFNHNFYGSMPVQCERKNKEWYNYDLYHNLPSLKFFGKKLKHIETIIKVRYINK